MPSFRRLLMIVPFALAVSGCGVLYKQPIYQGNLLEKEAVDQLEKGLKAAPRDVMAKQLRDEMQAKLPKPATPITPPPPSPPPAPGIDNRPEKPAEPAGPVEE